MSGSNFRLKKHQKQILLLLASTLLTLGGAEVAYRIYTNVHYRWQLKRWTHPLFILTPGDPMVYSLRPTTRGTGHLSDKRDAEWSYSINEDGFRGRAPGPKSPGITRILMMGDSYTFGWGLNESGDPYPRRVEKLLNDESPTTRVEVINAGVPGYNTVQEAARLKKLLPKYQPDLVVWAYVMNDAEPQMSVPAAPVELYQTTRLWLPERIKEVLNTRFFPRGPRFHVNKYEYDFDYLRGFQPESPKSKASRQALADAANSARSQGVDFILVIIPDFTKPFDDSYPFSSIHATVQHWGSELGLRTLDLLPSVRGQDHTKLWIEGDGHPNGEGHRIIAEQIAILLQSSLPRPN